MNAAESRSSAIAAIELIASFGVALSSAEWLVSARHLRDDGLLSWPISQLRRRALTSGLLARALNPLFRFPAIAGLILLRLCSALALLLALLAGASNGAVSTLLIVLIAATAIAISLRSPYGLDGSDQMATFLFATLALARLVPRPVVENAFLLVVALQSALAYFTAGYAKLISPIWRSGAAIPGISSTRMYGSRSVAQFVQGRGWLCLGIAWSTILAECLFPLALIAPRPIALTLLAAGMAFHILSGVTMGLNTFIWSFLATYPAVLWCNACVHDLFGRLWK